MSQYLELADTSYVSDGVTLTESLIIRASALIDGYCRREIGLKAYKERIPLTNQRGHLSFYPVIEIDSVKGRASSGLMGNFFGAPGFVEMDKSNIDVDLSTGVLMSALSPFGSTFAELEVEYTSGWEVIPEKVKVACGLLVNQLVANPNSNVKSKKDFDFSIEYFGNSMITPEIANLLSEYKILFMR